MLGREGMNRVADYATLNANYLMARLSAAGFDVAFPVLAGPIPFNGAAPVAAPSWNCEWSKSLTRPVTRGGSGRPAYHSGPPHCGKRCGIDPIYCRHNQNEIDLFLSRP